MMKNDPEVSRAIALMQEMRNGARDSLLEAWKETLVRCGRRPAIFDTSGMILRCFVQIAAEAGLYEYKFRKLPAGAVIAIQLGNHPSWPGLLIGCWRQKLVVLPLERTITTAERDATLKAFHAAALITSDGLDFEGIKIARRKAAAVAWGNRRPALLKLTSGTTAAPRAIRFRSDQLLADCSQICETMGITERDLNFGVIPVSHSYGFSNLLLPLLTRGVSMVLSRDRMPRAILDDLARAPATVFPGMPIFYGAFSEMDDVPALPKLRLCISAGAPLPLPVARKFRDKFGHSIHSFYGSSECGGICYDRRAPLSEPGFVGAPMNGVQLEALEPSAPLSRMRVRSAATADGYFPVPEEEKLGHGSFVPDDLLVATGGGFRIVGRVSDVINVAGKKVHPAEIETVLLSFGGVREAVAFGRESALRNQEVAACVVAAPTVTEAALREFCRGKLSGWQVPKRIFLLETMPVTERGKISRRALAERFAS